MQYRLMLIMLHYLKVVAILIIITGFVNTKAYSQIITTVAYGFDHPVNALADKLGNLYITENKHIRKILPNGTVYVIAGNGNVGISGDGGPATSAQIDYPIGIVKDKLGNIYFSEDIYGVIRKIDNNGIISTINLTTGLYYPSGMTIDTAGNIYIADLMHNRIVKLTPNGFCSIVAGNGTSGFSGDGGLATAATLNQPLSVAVDPAGNLYISDLNNHRIRKVDTNGIITTLAGTGSAGFSGDGGLATAAQINEPNQLTSDAAGNIYFSDNQNNRIRKVSVNGVITTVVGNGNYGYSGDGGPATAAEIYFSLGLSFDTAGNLYFADASNNVIRKVTGLTNTLPVTLRSFTATKQVNDVLIKWVTSTEINTTHFNVQKSTTGKDFVTIDAINAKGAGEYSYNDPITTEDARFKKLYYRLQIVDKDGVLSYSEVRELSIVNSQFSITPNPAKDFVTILGTNLKQVKLLDNQCRVVAVKESANSNSVSIPVSHIAKGIYMVQATFKDGSVKTEKVVVE